MNKKIYPEEFVVESEIFEQEKRLMHQYKVLKTTLKSLKRFTEAKIRGKVGEC